MPKNVTRGRGACLALVRLHSVVVFKSRSQRHEYDSALRLSYVIGHHLRNRCIKSLLEHRCTCSRWISQVS
jgi:hypothetical protein